MARENAYFKSQLSRLGYKTDRKKTRTINTKRIFAKLLVELEQRYQLIPQTREWLDSWTKTPSAQVFTSTDWNHIRMLVPLVDRYFKTNSHHLLAEIRMNESLLGATIKDRKEILVDRAQRKHSKEPLEIIETG
jgi:hypothetical protein